MKKIRRGIVVLFILLLSFTLIASGCSDKPDTAAPPPSNSGGGTNTAPAESGTGGENEVAVGKWEVPMLSVLTGPVAFAGVPAGWGAEYAAKVINEEGGVRGVPLEITVRDTAFDPAKAVSEISGFVDNALVVLGPMDGPGFDAAGQVAFDAKVPIIGAATTTVVRDKYQPYGSSYMTDSDKGAMDAVTKWLGLNPDFKKAVIFYIPSDNANTSEYELVKDTMIAAGVEVVGAVEIETGELDLGPAATKALGFGADAYFVNLRTEEFSRAVIELRNRGVDEGRRIMGSFSAVSSNLFDLGGDALQGVYIWNKINPNSTDSGWLEFVAAFEAENGSKPENNTGANFYEAVFLLKNAIEDLELTGAPAKLHEERDKLSAYLFNTPVQTSIQGSYQISNGEKVAQPFLFQMVDNTYQIAN